MSAPTPSPEAWLAGPIEGVDPYLLPVAHALVQARRDVELAVSGLTPTQLGEHPAGAASLAFHVRHLAGSLDRLLTYARGEALSEAQRDAAAAESDVAAPADAPTLMVVLDGAIDRALAQVRATPRATLLEERLVGRARLPSNVLGLLFHAAEHAQRHTGQIVTTARIVRAASSSSGSLSLSGRAASGRSRSSGGRR